METWKELKQIHRQKGIDVKYLLSNKGNIKMVAYYKNIYVDEEQLSIGNGICIHNNELYIYHMKKEPLHRIFYKLFNGDIPKGYQIHHKDYNHYNNDINNLECLSPYKHGCKHSITSKFMYNVPNKFHWSYYEYQLWLNSNSIMDKINNIQYTKEEAIKDILDIYKRFEDNMLPIREQYFINKSKEIKERNEKKFIQDRQDKLTSGEYYVNIFSRLSKKHRPKWTEERRRKTMMTRERNKT